MINQPLVSVITPIFNAEKFIPRLFKSIRDQCGVNLEHILVDDSSTDNSFNVLKKFAEDSPQIKVYRLSKNSGPVIARNYAISKASGKFLAFLDADDFWMPEKSLIQTNFMREKNAAISFSDYRFISEDGGLIGRRIRGFDRVDWSLHHYTRYLGCLTIMIDREKCPNFRFPHISPAHRAEDFLAWSHVLKEHGVAHRCPHDLARYAIVKNSRSSQFLIASFSVWLLYRNIERISLFRAATFFFGYLIFASYKRLFFRPRLGSLLIDGSLAVNYKL